MDLSGLQNTSIDTLVQKGTTTKEVTNVGVRINVALFMNPILRTLHLCD